jgi:hypothetical protein
VGVVRRIEPSRRLKAIIARPFDLADYGSRRCTSLRHRLGRGRQQRAMERSGHRGAGSAATEIRNGRWSPVSLPMAGATVAGLFGPDQIDVMARGNVYSLPRLMISTFRVTPSITLMNE